jgi:hypothetical protein
MFEKSPSGLEVVQSGGVRQLAFFHGRERVTGPDLTRNLVQLRVCVRGDQANYSYSLDDGRAFHLLGSATPLHFSWWKGSRPSLFAYTTLSSDPGVVDFKWAHYRALAPNPW